jgi:thioredoxin reductase
VVAVVGGGDTACEEAVYLAGLAKQVYLIVRKPYLRASQIMQERVLNHPKIQVLFEHNTVGLFGENGVEGVHLVKRKGEADEEFYDLAIDGFFYRKKVVAVVGGGDTACEEAVYLAGLAKQVYLIVRKPYLRASQIMQERVLNHPKIQVLFEHNTVGLFGENGVEGVHLVKRKGEADEEFYDLAIDGFFLAIGHNPNSEVFKPWIETDEVGYIVTEGATPRTRVPGVFAAGDVADPHYRQAITAAGSGCKAAIEAERFLSANGLL